MLHVLACELQLRLSIRGAICIEMFIQLMLPSSNVADAQLRYERDKEVTVTLLCVWGRHAVKLLNCKRH